MPSVSNLDEVNDAKPVRANSRGFLNPWNNVFFMSSDPSGGFSKRFFTFQLVAFSFSGAALHSPAPFDRLGGGFDIYFQCVGR